MKLIVKLVLSAIAIIILAKLLPGVTLTPPYTNALIAAVVLVLLNVFLRPILIILTLPMTILTLGLFLLIINAAIVLLADKMVDGFSVSSIWTAILFSILYSILQSMLHSIIKEDKE